MQSLQHPKKLPLQPCIQNISLFTPPTNLLALHNIIHLLKISNIYIYTFGKNRGVEKRRTHIDKNILITNVVRVKNLVKKYFKKKNDSKIENKKNYCKTTQKFASEYYDKKIIFGWFEWICLFKFYFYLFDCEFTCIYLITSHIYWFFHFRNIFFFEISYEKNAKLIK